MKNMLRPMQNKLVYNSYIFKFLRISIFVGRLDRSDENPAVFAL